MPQGFNTCVKSGGKVRTKTLEGGKYVRICVKDGKSYSGEVKESKTTVKDAKKKVDKTLPKREDLPMFDRKPSMFNKPEIPLQPEPRKKNLRYTPGRVKRAAWDKPAKILR